MQVRPAALIRIAISPGCSNVSHWQRLSTTTRRCCRGRHLLLLTRSTLGLYPPERTVTDSKQIKAYIQDASGQLVPLAVDSVVLEFPSGDSLEIAWEEPHPNDHRTVCVQVWGGRRVSGSLSMEEIEAQSRATSVALLPSAANLVLIHPYSYPIRKRD